MYVFDRCVCAYACACMSTCVHVCAMGYVWRPEDGFVEPVLSWFWGLNSSH